MDPFRKQSEPLAVQTSQILILAILAFPSTAQRAAQPGVFYFYLSSGVKVLANAGGLTAPPWQLVSASLGGVSLRVASFWTGTKIYSTTAQTKVSCLPAEMGTPAAVEIATTGTWHGAPIGFTGSFQMVAGTSLGPNHAKIGVSTNDGGSLTIFGDMNQDGVLSSQQRIGCLSSQNVRGGLFFIVDNVDLHHSVSALLTGKKAPTQAFARIQRPSLQRSRPLIPQNDSGRV